jgi:formylglycine-generating enzyme required for sulfatase activity
MLRAAWKYQGRLLAVPMAVLMVVIPILVLIAWNTIFVDRVGKIVARLRQPSTKAAEIPGIVQEGRRWGMPVEGRLASRLQQEANKLELFEADTEERSAAPVDRQRYAARLVLASAVAGNKAPTSDFLVPAHATARESIIQNLSEVFTDPKVVVDWLVRARANKENPSTLYALLIAMGNYRTRQLERIRIDDRSLQEWLLDLHLSDHDPGVHSAAGWLLRVKLGVAKAKVSDVASKAGACKTSTLTPAASDPRHWCITPEGVAMAVFPPGVSFPMGIYNAETSQNNARRHCRTIDRAFAIALEEVNNAQIRACPDIQGRPSTDPQSPGADQPATRVSWDDAARYCNWLNRQAEPPLQDCYELQPTSEDGRTPARMVPAPNALEKNGYRLPTEAEWEYTCRAGTESPFFFGNDPNWLGAYASPNKRSETYSVGSFRPNGFGIFDAYSNVTEWCHDPDGQYPPRSEDCTHDDPAAVVCQYYQVRGVNPFNYISNANSFARENVRFDQRMPFRGFRLARTCRVAAHP